MYVFSYRPIFLILWEFDPAKFIVKFGKWYIGLYHNTLIVFSDFLWSAGQAKTKTKSILNQSQILQKTEKGTIHW